MELTIAISVFAVGCVVYGIFIATYKVKNEMTDKFERIIMKSDIFDEDKVALLKRIKEED